MPDVNVTQNQITVTPDTSTLSLTTSPVEVVVQKSATAAVVVSSPVSSLEIQQPTAEIFIAQALGPQGPAGTVINNSGMTVDGSLIVNNNLNLEGSLKTKLDGGKF